MRTHRRWKRHSDARWTALAAALTLLLLPACGEPDADSDGVPGTDPVETGSDRAPNDAVGSGDPAAPGDGGTPDQATISVEGAPQTVPVATFESPANFPLPFRALVPDTPRVATSVDWASGTSVEASARFEWTPANGQAFLRLVVLGAGVDSASAMAIARGDGADFGVPGTHRVERDQAAPRPVHAWAVAGSRLRGTIGSTPVTGWISVGRREGRFFYFMALYPPEYGDGLGPRFDYILRHWRWQSPAAPLGR